VYNFLGNSKHCAAIEQTAKKEILCVFTGSQEDAAWILSQLTLQETTIYDFTFDEDNVEDIFLKIGAKEVS
ncbi:MAG: hypothetical protein K8I82_27440, partial [Anaerolineae bacterium]|nr:hypothetical protein [Anaerolineae bacterium]